MSTPNECLCPRRPTTEVNEKCPIHGPPESRIAWLERKLTTASAENATLKGCLSESQSVNKEMGDALERIALRVGVMGVAAMIANGTLARIAELESEYATLKAKVGTLQKQISEIIKEQVVQITGHYSALGKANARIRELEVKLKVADLALRSIDAATSLEQARRRSGKALAQLSQEGETK